MLLVGAGLIGVVVGVIGYTWLFARRSPRKRLAYAVVLAVVTPVVLFALVIGFVALSFAVGG